jgi:hypothetical protein
VEAGAKAYRALTVSDPAAVKEFFTKEGAFEDLAGPAFLLANAFRINSTQNPEKIPQVKLFKLFKADAEAVQALAKKKKPTQAAFDASLESLTTYLQAVGLN